MVAKSNGVVTRTAIVMALVGSLCVAFVGASRANVALASADTAHCDMRFKVCVSKAYQPVFSQSAGIGPPSASPKADPNAVKTLGVLIHFYNSDVVQSAGSTAGMEKFCLESGCAYTAENCDGQRCTFEYVARGAYNGRFYPETLFVDYTSEGALATAKENIFMAIGTEGSKHWVPFSQIFQH